LAVAVLARITVPLAACVGTAKATGEVSRVCAFVGINKLLEVEAKGSGISVVLDKGKARGLDKLPPVNAFSAVDWLPAVKGGCVASRS
jgi:hypothetical protein